VTQPRQRLVKIEQARQMGVRQDAEGSGDMQVPQFGFRAAIAIIDEDAVGTQQFSQRQRGRFPRVQETESRV